LSGDASGTAIAFGAVTNAHSGTSPTQAEVILLSRNNVVLPVNNSFHTFIYAGAGATFEASWTEYSRVGVNVTNKIGVYMLTTAAAGGSSSISHCSAHD